MKQRASVRWPAKPRPAPAIDWELTARVLRSIFSVSALFVLYVVVPWVLM